MVLASHCPVLWVSLPTMTDPLGPIPVANVGMGKPLASSPGSMASQQSLNVENLKLSTGRVADFLIALNWA